ncbi:CYTH and CHAD domain-containing protein [Corynebacterium sp. Marseille-P3884]|uniref:CYTH and CHAD domain-containing protein n=1 Tax=Corynebacterium sp. Marseille-P3884 TaxID=2495409 RepID=UPI001B33089B|nr:CYTH and CHAD domain-containing protein [Corynebacterium sp. Marseille-P3884]MBP3947291.1 CYTH and CHAD domain-containing protein [Corynebacterium sp. Marseille-P3884]
MSTQPFIEVEAKFAVDDSIAVPDLTALSAVESAGETVNHSLSAIYYDTADLRLTRAKVTLRRRTGGKDDGWHIKLPGASGRTELHAELTDPSTPPDELLAAVRAIIRGEPLAPIAQVDNDRAETPLFDAAGDQIAEFCDDHVTAWSLLPGGQQTSWREWEVELSGELAETVDGNALLHEATSLLINRGARKSASSSKLATALGDSAAAAPVPPYMSAGGLDEDSPAKAVVDSLRVQRDRLVEWDPKVRNDEWDSVHQMRVATRELRSLLETFEGILAGDQIKHVESELKQLAALLGTARDAEVVEERFIGLLDSDTTGMIDDPAAEHVRGDMRREYERAHRRILRTLDSQRYLTLLDDIDAILADPPLATDTPAEEDAGEAAAAESATAESASTESAPAEARTSEEILYEHLERGYKKLAKRHKLALEHYPDMSLPLHDREEYVHDVRKAAKKLRYSANAAKDSGLKASKLSKACKELQEILGDYQDAVTSRDRIEKLAAGARKRGEDTFSYGMLYQREMSRGDKALKDYPKAFKEVKKAFKKVEPKEN